MRNDRVDPASIDVLQNALARIGCFNSVDNEAIDKVWGLVVNPESSYTEDDLQFVDGMRTLHHLRETQRTMTILLASLERVRASLRRATQSAVLSRGIRDLPDELLSHIFLFYSTGNWKSTLRITSVSRRFRSIAFATPRLWACLPPATMDPMGRSALRAWLALSKSVGLEVELPLLLTKNDERQNPDWDEALQLLMTQKDRWRDLTVDTMAVCYSAKEEGYAPNVLFPKATFRSLETLFIGEFLARSSSPYFASSSAVFYDDFNPEFYENWKFPRLKSLTLEMHIPPPGVFPAITDFSLDISIHDWNIDEGSDDSDEQRRSPLEPLVDFLNSVPALQRLELIVGEYTYNSPRGTATLPSLTKLHVENRYADRNSLIVTQRVVHALRMPAIEDVTLTIHVDDETEAAGLSGDRWLSALLPEPHSYKHLKHIALDCIVEKSIGSMALKHIDQFQALEEFEVCMWNAPFISAAAASDLIRKKVPLRRLRLALQFCDSFEDRQSAVRVYTFDDDQRMRINSFLE